MVFLSTFAARMMNMRQILMALLLMPLTLMAQEATVLKQRKFPKTVPAGNYSGIAWLGGSKYAVANDKSPTTGFYLMTIDTDNITGELLSVHLDTFLTCGQPTRDEEGICYMPQNQTIFVSGEKDQEILEFDLQGQLTGRKLNIPEIFKTAYSNRGFEALTYQPVTHRFWTTSENTLQADGEKRKSRTVCAFSLLVMTCSPKSNIGMRLIQPLSKSAKVPVLWELEVWQHSMMVGSWCSNESCISPKSRLARIVLSNFTSLIPLSNSLVNC